MKVVFFPTLKEAQAFESECYKSALSEGQICDRWAEIITDKVLGFGVPVKERLTVPEKSLALDWTPDVISAI